MLPISKLDLGFNDAENYKRRENKELFAKFFYRNSSLEKLCDETTCFLIGEKGTGKTAYAVFLENNNYHNICGSLHYLRETEYQKFIQIKNSENLQLSEYVNIWKVILYLLLAEQIVKRQKRQPVIKLLSPFRELYAAIEDFYAKAFSPEIITAFQFVEGYEVAAKLIATQSAEVGASLSESLSRTEKKFQTNLLYIERKFEQALRSLRLEENFLLCVDGIDIRPSSIAFEDYLDCVKGLANAVWTLNNDIFANIKGSPGRLRCVLLIRPDIFESLGLQNRNSKIRDNAVLLDWKTTYPQYRNSEIFLLIDRMLQVQQDREIAPGQSWDHYFPFDSFTENSEGSYPTSFISFLRFSLFRPRDVITMMSILQDLFVERQRSEEECFTSKDFDDAEFRRRYSEYLLGEVKDHLSFYYTEGDYEAFLKFFEFLSGKYKFDYQEYVLAFSQYSDYFRRNKIIQPKFCETHDTFLQFLYDLNILCFVEDTDGHSFISWCYRDRSPSKISPKVKTHRRYEIHYGITKALNLGKEFHRRGYEYAGSVKWYDAKKGYGFIEQSGGKEDIFVHASTLAKSGLESIVKGQEVYFDVVPGKNGKLQADNLHLERKDARAKK